MAIARRKCRSAIILGAIIAIGPTIVLYGMVTFLFVVPLVCGIFVLAIGWRGYDPTARYQLPGIVIISILFSAVGVFGPIGLIWHHRQPGTPIHFVLPSGFRGGFKLVLDETIGVPLIEQDGKITIRIPAGGILKVRTFAPFERWHAETAAFSNGTILANENSVGSNAIALRGGATGSSSGGGRPLETYSWSFVGTHQDYLLARTESPFPIGRVMTNEGENKAKAHSEHSDDPTSDSKSDGGLSMMALSEREESLSFLRSCIHADVAGGFDSYEDIVETAIELVKDDFPGESCEELVKPIVLEAFQEHIRTQANWPAKTDCDRMDAAFDELNRAGIVARQHFSCCGTCAAGEIRDVMSELIEEGGNVRGYTSYDVQSTQNAVAGHGVALNYGSIDEGEAAALRVGHEVVDALARHGLKVEWDGSWDHRIMVSLDWKRRRDPFAPPFKGKRPFSIKWLEE